jgi:redox-sensitive bicupin YhaK (pirin superfamily)
VPDCAPGYQQIAFAPSEKQSTLRLIAAPAGVANGHALAIHQDARVYAAAVDSADRLTYGLAPGRAAWVHCAAGGIVINGLSLAAGDGLAVTDESSLSVHGTPGLVSELLLFDLA